ncbi:E3 ubiquitin-protein ligase SH3RF1 isoform X2 [Nematostella vectensis]|uniref:E3 ubiquitin-protein ligase SH3RF1 isoform X2 n=1 Tax=Nematostella vectensis TaxID=45351 RepID=UPI0020775AE4|nr:E3 ubiquitin-protein ligase SH3RF1 isoform X2 [Nematostella vectensis]
MSLDSVELNELLECSVCLERLDHTSKVLPCQHTFCRRCLKEIQAAKKELRCPECRILVDQEVDELPSNILLVRILEGLNRKRPNSSDQRTTKPCARVLYDFEPREQGDLALCKGDFVYLLRQVDENWFEGQVNGCQGFLPSNYVEVISALPCLDDDYNDPVAKALYDFDGGEEQDILPFKQGDVISVIRKVDENWCEGKLNNKCGIFPINFVELNSVAKAIIISPEGVAGPSGASAANGPIAKPARKSKTKEKVPKRHTIHGGNNLEQSSSLSQTPNRHSVEITTSERLEQAFGDAGVSSRADPPVTTALLGDLSDAVTTSISSRTQTLPNRPLPPPNSLVNGHTQSPSFTSSVVTSPLTVNLCRPLVTIATSCPPVTTTAQAAAPRPNSAEIGKELYTALYNYKPQKEDELELKQGECYYVLEKCKDGWFKGVSLHSQKRGVFPGNYVRLTSIHSLLTSSRSSTRATQQAPTPSPRQIPRPLVQNPVQTRPRYHRSESTPTFLVQRTVPTPTENHFVVTRTTNNGMDEADQPFVPLIPPPPVPKTGSFWKKLKNKKKDRTSDPPAPPPPYRRAVPSGHMQLSMPLNNHMTPVTPPPPYTVQPRPTTRLHAAQVAREGRPHSRQENVPISERYSWVGSGKRPNLRKVPRHHALPAAERGGA